MPMAWGCPGITGPPRGAAWRSPGGPPLWPGRARTGFFYSNRGCVGIYGFYGISRDMQGRAGGPHAARTHTHNPPDYALLGHAAPDVGEPPSCSPGGGTVVLPHPCQSPPHKSSPFPAQPRYLPSPVITCLEVRGSWGSSVLRRPPPELRRPRGLRWPRFTPGGPRQGEGRGLPGARRWGLRMNRNMTAPARCSGLTTLPPGSESDLPVPG